MVRMDTTLGISRFRRFSHKYDEHSYCYRLSDNDYDHDVSFSSCVRHINNNLKSCGLANNNSLLSNYSDIADIQCNLSNHDFTINLIYHSLSNINGHNRDRRLGRD